MSPGYQKINTFFEEREKIRNHQLTSFSQEITSDTQFAVFSPFLYKISSASARESLQKLCLGEPQIARILSSSRNLEPELANLFFHWLEKNIKTILSDTSIDLIWKTLPPPLQAKLTKTPHESQICFSQMHITESKRFDDSDLFLVTRSCIEKRIERNPNCAFLGGSFGITALEFLLALKQTGIKNCNVYVGDLFTPEDISRRYFNSEQKRLSSLQYIQCNLLALPFRKSTFSFIDACNCLGYLNNLNDRSKIILSIWETLQIGGYLRLTTPNYESIFEQVIFEKTGRAISDFKITYVSMRGKTYRQLNVNRLDATDEMHYWEGITLKILTLRKQSTRLDEITGESQTKAIYEDIMRLSPLSFGMGVIDSGSIYNLRNAPTPHHLWLDNRAKELANALDYFNER